MKISPPIAGLPIAALLSSAGAAPAPDVAGFKKHIQPLLADLCMDCHNGSKPKGDFSLGDISGDLVAGPDAEKWIKVLDQLTLGEMPPEDESQPSEGERAGTINWIRAELLKGGRKPPNKLARPGSGNYVRHERLFGTENLGPSFSEPRVWRIRPAVYESAMRGVAKDAKLLPVAGARSWRRPAD